MDIAQWKSTQSGVFKKEGLLDTMVYSIELVIRKKSFVFDGCLCQWCLQPYINSEWKQLQVPKPKYINIEVEHEKWPFEFPCMCEAMVKSSTKVPYR
jgi:hypothetical protein